ncbi:glycoside hydrolase family 13 protein [Tundrisphaera sp. TA3]|uniref:glycoside hydrolase family 13 protein n=1 Tax=Tundrisphaera sp. TA3 TaxID=3435775 RepID=UPI003EB8BC35
MVLEPQTPDWVRDAIFYQIFPDRFARSLSLPKPQRLDEWGSAPTPHGYQGGDLLGVVERLDYLVDLGINAIYFTPIFQSASNHRYHTHDYERVDPMLGGEAALRRLVDESHARGIRVVLDGVFNHASRGFFQFHDILENGENSAYLDWFTVHGWPLNAYDHAASPSYNAWWGLHALPKFNTDTPAVREYLWGIGRKWIEFGIDGWRLDVANEIDDDSFWREFRRKVRAANPEAYIVGEIWESNRLADLTPFASGEDRNDEATRWLRGDMWDAVMNYAFTRACLAFFIGDRVDPTEIGRTGFRKLDPVGAPAFRTAIERLLAHNHPNTTGVMLNLLDSHDLARFRYFAKGDASAVRLATLFQMTYPGAPSIYYGDEIGLDGGHDPFNREAFPWHRTDTWDLGLLHDFQKMVALRKARPSLRRGSFAFMLAENDVVAYVRQLGDETVIVALNTATETRRVDLNAHPHLAEGAVLEDVWNHEAARVEDGHLRSIELAPRTGRVFATPAPAR